MTLERALRVRHPVGSSPARRYLARTATRIASQVALSFSIALGLSFLILEGGAGPSAAGRARKHVASHAAEARAIWQRDPQLTCRDVVTSIVGYGDEPMDWWGNQMRYRCVDGERRIAIISAGEDGRFDTGDDIRSET